MVTVGCNINPAITSKLTVGEDKGDLLHKGPQPNTETITSTQLDHRLHCLIQGVQYNDKLHSSALKAVEFWWKVDFRTIKNEPLHY